jgi:hypothetical protein
MSKKIIGVMFSFIFSLFFLTATTIDNNIMKTQDINYIIDINYPTINQVIDINLTIINNSNKLYPVLLKIKDLPDSIESNLIKQNILLDGNKSIVVPIKLNYTKSDINKIEYTLNFGNKLINIPIILEKDKMPVFSNTNNITAFFTLAENNSKFALIVFDILLFVIAIVLFTMFIGRLGNFIIKK